VLGLAVVLFIICGSKFELQYFLIPTFAKRNHVSGKASIFMNLPVAPFYVMPPDKAAAIKILLYR
jgi:hypothetical protein